MSGSRKKAAKMRGHRTHGYGSQKKHRGKGSRGGRGLAGSEGHRRTFLLKYMKDHMCKKGFRSRREGKLKTINLRDLDKISGAAKKIDLSEMGYGKVLGAGEITKKLEVRARSFSARAAEKIAAAGGKAIPLVQPEEEEPAGGNSDEPQSEEDRQDGGGEEEPSGKAGGA